MPVVDALRSILENPVQVDLLLNEVVVDTFLISFLDFEIEEVACDWWSACIVDPAWKERELCLRLNDNKW
ncbi:hypothetical protein Aduo_016906 [Ancylostoma duodenale]